MSVTKNCGIDIFYLFESSQEEFDFINLPIKDMGNILSVISNDKEEFNLMAQLIEKYCPISYKNLSYNDIIYNYLINSEDIHNIIYEVLMKNFNIHKQEIIEVVNNN